MRRRGRRSREGAEGGQRGEDRDRDREAAEALHEPDPEPLLERDDDRVRAERIALGQQLRAAPSASRSAASRCWDMSGLKLVPRIPKRPSTMNGSEAASSAASATGEPARSASAPPSTRPRR